MKRPSYRFDDELAMRMSKLGIEPVAVTPSFGLESRTSSNGEAFVTGLPELDDDSESGFDEHQLRTSANVAEPSYLTTTVTDTVLSGNASIGICDYLHDAASFSELEAFSKSKYAVENIYALYAIELLRRKDFQTIERLFRRIDAHVDKPSFAYILRSTDSLSEFQRVELNLARKVYDVFFKHQSAQYWACLAQPVLNQLCDSLSLQQPLNPRAFDDCRHSLMETVQTQIFPQFLSLETPAAAALTKRKLYREGAVHSSTLPVTTKPKVEPSNRVKSVRRSARRSSLLGFIFSSSASSSSTASSPPKEHPTGIPKALANDVAFATYDSETSSGNVDGSFFTLDGGGQVVPSAYLVTPPKPKNRKSRKP